jgi:hypothetical protein
LVDDAEMVLTLNHQREISRELAFDESSLFAIKLSETKWLKSSLLLLPRRKYIIDEILRKNRTTTFGFALSCNFYERPNVSERMENDYFHVFFFFVFSFCVVRQTKEKKGE